VCLLFFDNSIARPPQFLVQIGTADRLRIPNDDNQPRRCKDGNTNLVRRFFSCRRALARSQASPPIDRLLARCLDDIELYGIVVRLGRNKTARVARRRRRAANAPRRPTSAARPTAGRRRPTSDGHESGKWLLTKWRNSHLGRPAGRSDALVALGEPAANVIEETKLRSCSLIVASCCYCRRRCCCVFVFVFALTMTNE
jgi:hypothetical protein